LGSTFKVSLHESGRCHIRGPNPRLWISPGPPPQFIEEWNIDPQSKYVFPFKIVIPTSELRAGSWFKSKEKETRWLPVTSGVGVEIGFHFSRVLPSESQLRSAGWHTTIISEPLPDGRHLWVLAGHAKLSDEKRREIELIKASARKVAAVRAPKATNLRLVLIAGGNEEGTRCFVEVAV
jgi:hypothetical protein